MLKFFSAGLAISLSAVCADTQPQNTVLFYGNSMVERLLEGGELEAYMQLSQKEKKAPQLAVRSLAWTGDEVGYRLRPTGYVKHMTKLLKKWEANTIVLGFGMNESFAGADGVNDFKSQYVSFLKQLTQSHKNAKFILLSPTAVETEQYPSLGKVGAAAVAQPDTFSPTALNANIQLYADAIKEVAAEANATYIDILTPSKEAYAAEKEPLTSNGLFLNKKGNQIVAKAIASQLSKSDIGSFDTFHHSQLAKAAGQKHSYVAEIVRPKNSVVYFGVRQRPQEYLAEIPRYHQLVEQSDVIIKKLLDSPNLDFNSLEKPSLPALPPIKGRKGRKGNGVIKSPAEAMAEFKVADGYEISLFASEEEFPELRNPVQVAFDAQGRLWVVTMPSFPHTVPGLPQEDKILILEDTDKDGKADKSTVYASGFDALDGITFHHTGPIISAQPKHFLLKDLNGDDKVDETVELMRGIDMTDSHHGGMLAADPYGGIIFSDGVFHRSQLETPYGNVRAMDATTYRHDLYTRELRVEWQSATPNPWAPTFDKWGDTYQMYGDGLVIDGLAMTWSPLGVYHPFKFGTILGYGKGSGVAVISGDNFPSDYQQGFASASLLGSYTVSITKASREEGQVKGSDRLDLVSSKNPAFRPAALAFGMDGALYISDFCSSIIGHAQHAMRDPGWDSKHGRIWRVEHKKNPIVKDFPAIKGASLPALCELLKNTNDLVREHARIEIRKHGDKGVTAAEEWIKGQSKNSADYEQSALEVIFISEGLGKTQPKLLEELIASKTAEYRSAALHTIRLQANRLENPMELLQKLLTEKHPRVQMQLVDAIAHMRKELPQVIDLSESIKTDHSQVKEMLTFLKHGVKSHKQRSIPVLSVSPAAKINFWVNSKGAFEYGKKSPFTVGKYQTFIHSASEQPAILGVMCNYINVSVNGVRLLSDNERWSSDQQVNFTLKKGINVIEMEILEGKKNKASAVSIYDTMGEKIENATLATSEKNLTKLEGLYKKDQEKFAGAIKVQAVPHQLKFSPTKLSVKAGSKVRLIVENPDAMVHNFVIMKPGTRDAVGALADAMAADPEGAKKAYVPDSSDVLFATKLLNPETTEELTFTAPSEPGEYPFLCTVPGHWRVMQGVITVN